MEHHEVVIIGAGLSGIYQLHRAPRDRRRRARRRGRRGPRRHVVPQPVPGLPVRLGELHLRLLVLQGAARRVGLERALLLPARERCEYLNHVADRFGLREHMRFGCKVERGHLRRRQPHLDARRSPAPSLSAAGSSSPPSACSPRHSCPASRGSTGSGAPGSTPTTGPTRAWTSRASGVAVIGTGATAVQLIAEIAGTVSRAVRLPAPPQLVRAAAQPPHRRRRDGRDQALLRRDLRAVPADPRRLHPQARPAQACSRCPRRSATSSTRSCTRPPASASGRATSATC